MQSLLRPPRQESVGSLLGQFEAVGAPSEGRGVDPAEFADKYGYGLARELLGRIQGEVLHPLP